MNLALKPKLIPKQVTHAKIGVPKAIVKAIAAFSFLAKKSLKKIIIILLKEMFLTNIWRRCKMSKTIIPSDKKQENRMNNPGKNNIFVGSRQGGSMEHSRTKQASIKHNNPEYFKRQTDRKNADNYSMKK